MLYVALLTLGCGALGAFLGGYLIDEEFAVIWGFTGLLAGGVASLVLWF